MINGTVWNKPSLRDLRPEEKTCSVGYDVNPLFHSLRNWVDKYCCLPYARQAKRVRRKCSDLQEKVIHDNTLPYSKKIIPDTGKPDMSE